MFGKFINRVGKCRNRTRQFRYFGNNQGVHSLQRHPEECEKGIVKIWTCNSIERLFFLYYGRLKSFVFVMCFRYWSGIRRQ